MQNICRERKSGWKRVAQVGGILFIALLAWGMVSGEPGGRVSAMGLAQAPTPTGLQTLRLTGASVNRTAPAEAVKEIDLRVGGGTYPGCLDQADVPTLDFKTDNLELTDIAIIATCGWKPDEVVKVSVLDPLGKVTTREIKAVPAKHKSTVYEVDVFYQPGIDAPEGKYRFTLQSSGAAQDNSAIKAKVTFNRPKTARFYALTDDPFQPKFGTVGGQQRLRLQGFLPEEPVRLLIYQFKGTRIQFYGYQDFMADRAGRMVIETDLPDISKDTEINFFAYGRDTHFVSMERFSRESYSISRQFDMDLYCPGAQPLTLSSGSQVRATAGAAAGGATLAIHYQPGFGSMVTGRVPGDTIMRVYAYPKCIDHAYWWKVSLTQPILFGWVPESYLGKYMVEPVK